MPQGRPSLTELYGGTQTPRRPSLADLYASEPPTEPRGYLDQLKNMSGRDWLATAIRLGGGYLAGIPSMVPGVGTAIGGAIGGGSEALAQRVAGQAVDPQGIAIGTGLGMVPMGKVIGLLGTGAGMGARAANLAANAGKGAAINVAADMSHRFGSKGEVPFRDYSLREELLPAAIGLAGGSALNVADETVRGWRALRPSSTNRAAQTPVPADGQQGFNFDAGTPTPTGPIDRGTLAKARAAIRDPDALAMFDHQFGAVGAPAPRPAARPSLAQLRDEAAQVGPPGGSRLKPPVPADIDAPLPVPEETMARMLGLEEATEAAGRAGAIRGSRASALEGGDDIDALIASLGVDPSRGRVGLRGPTDVELASPTYGAMATPEAGQIQYRNTGESIEALAPDETVLGRATYTRQPDGSLVMGDIRVNPNHQRQGIGTRLLETLRETFPGAALDRGALASPEGQVFRAATARAGDVGAPNPLAVSEAIVPRGTGAAPEAATPFYLPRQVRELYDELSPRWAADVARQTAAGEPLLTDPRMSLEDFAQQTMFEPDPRRLMGKQRAVRTALDAMDPRAIEMVDLEGRPMPGMDTPAPSLTPDGPAAPRFTPTPSLSDRAETIVQEFLAGVPPPEGVSNPAYYRADAYRQARTAALERLRADIPVTTPYRELPLDLQAELRRVHDEMTSLPFVGKSFDFTVPGQGGTPDVKAGAAGAPVFHDIKAGSRNQVISALGKYMEGKKPSKVAQRALDVALRRLVGGRGEFDNPLSPAMLPPDAGYGGPLGIPMMPEPPAWAGETGAVSPGALYTLGSAAAGAVAGPMVDREGANPWLSAAGGGLLGAVGATAVRNPALLERIQSSNLFSNMAPITSAVGNLGGLAAFAAEHPRSAGKVFTETFSPQTLEAAKRAFKGGVVRENVEGFADQPMSPLSIPGRLIGAPDAATRDIIQRAMVASGEATGQGALPGFPNREVAELGGRYTLSGDPRSEFGRSTLDYLSKNRGLRLTVAPVARTPINWLETGLERTPGVGFLPGVQAMDPEATLVTRSLRQLGGLGAVGAGAAAGAALEDSDANAYLPLLAALAGPAGLPFTAGAVGAQLPDRARANAGSFDVPLQVLENLKRQIPLLGQTYFSPEQLLRRFVPYGGAGRALSGMPTSASTASQERPYYLDTSQSYFGPAGAQVPVFNEAVLPIKRRQTPPR